MLFFPLKFHCANSGHISSKLCISIYVTPFFAFFACLFFIWKIEPIFITRRVSNWVPKIDLVLRLQLIQNWSEAEVSKLPKNIAFQTLLRNFRFAIFLVFFHVLKNFSFIFGQWWSHRPLLSLKCINCIWSSIHLRLGKCNDYTDDLLWNSSLKFDVRSYEAKNKLSKDEHIQVC